MWSNLDCPEVDKQTWHKLLVKYPDVAKGVPIIYGVRLTYDLTHEYRYVGLTIVGTKRFSNHIYNATNPMSAAYNDPKYRWMRKHYLAVTFEVLEYVEDVALLNLSEQKWIHILRERGHRLLNLTDGGGGSFGFVISDISKKRMSAAAMGRSVSVDTRLKMSQTHTGRVHSSETISKMKGLQNSLGYRHTDEARERISKAQRGQTRTEETRLKMSKAQMGNQNGLGRIVSDETKLKLSEAKRGKPNIGSHVRWHTKREIVDPKCVFCMEGTK